MGCSAGALGVYLGVDEMADFIHREAVAGSDVVVRGLAVSGFFMEHSSNQTVDIHEAMRYNSLKDDGLIDNKLDYAESMRRVFTMMNLTAGADRKCIASHALHGTTSECIFARHLLPHLTTPTFSVQSQYDHWQILHIHGRNYSDEDVNRYGRSLSMQLLHASLEMHSASNTSGHGVFIESCAHHCVSCSEAHEDTWNGPKVRAHHLDLHSYSPGQAFKLWYARTTNTVVPPPSPPPPLTDLEGSILLRGSEPERHLVIQNNTLALPSHLQVYAMVDRLFVQNASYPCHACCSCAIRR